MDLTPAQLRQLFVPCMKIVSSRCYGVTHELMDELHKKRLTASLTDWPNEDELPDRTTGQIVGRIFRNKSHTSVINDDIEHRLEGLRAISYWVKQQITIDNIKYPEVSVRYSNEQTQYLYDYEISIIMEVGIQYFLIYVTCIDPNIKVLEYIERVGNNI